MQGSGHDTVEGLHQAGQPRPGIGARPVIHVLQRVAPPVTPDFYPGEAAAQQDRLDTLARVRNAAIKVCCGGIVGMGETRRQRAALLAQLANLAPQPESVPINHLVQVAGTPLHGLDPLDPLEFVRVIAVARITMPRARVRLSAGRAQLGEAAQALCFLAGANSIFYGERLLTTSNPQATSDQALMSKLGMRPDGLRA